MFPLKPTAICSLVVLICGTFLFAQPVERQRSAPTPDALIAYLGLNETQVACLRTNMEGFRIAVSDPQKQLWELQKQLREAARSGEDTTAIRSQIDSVRSSIQSLRDQHVSTAQLCVAGNPKLADLIAAEKLMNEVRQAIGLLLLQPTEIGGPGFGGNRPRGPRGPMGGPMSK